jgi:hypothetical protein
MVRQGLAELVLERPWSELARLQIVHPVPDSRVGTFDVIKLRVLRDLQEMLTIVTLKQGVHKS